MADINIACTVGQGFNFQKDQQDAVGHITALKIGDTELAADLSVTNPEEISGGKVPVVGVMSSIYWGGGFAESISFSCQVSIANKTEVAGMLFASLSNTNVEFQFNVYKFDPVEKKYFKAFHSAETSLLGLIQKEGGDLVLQMSEEAGYEVANPLNFDLTMGVNPQETSQDLHIALSVSSKQALSWGVQVG